MFFKEVLQVLIAEGIRNLLRFCPFLKLGQILTLSLQQFL